MQTPCFVATYAVMSGMKDWKRANMITETRVCLVCAVEISGHGLKKYCSDECSKEEYRRRDAAKRGPSTRIKWPEDTSLKERSLWSKYKIYVEEYDETMKQPCEICGAEAKHLDHNHETGQVRGALCAKCNIAVGVFEDENAAAVKEYLKRWNK